MGCFEKQRITTNLLQVALLLLYLRGDFPVVYHNNRNNSFNNSSLPEYNLGPSWGLAQTNFHPSGFDSVGIHPKAVHSFEPNLFDYNENDITDILRSHNLNNFRSHVSAITKVTEPVPSFQNVTAYLLSNTSASFADISNVVTNLERPQLLLSVNVDVPDSTETQVVDNNDGGSRTGQFNLEPQEVEIDNSFHLISGNIVFLPESDRVEDEEEDNIVPDSLAAVPDCISEVAIASPENDQSQEKSESTRSANQENCDDIGASNALFENALGAEESEDLWDQLQRDMDQLLDEEFSLGLALDEDALEMEDVLAADTVEDTLVNDSGDDELGMTAIPPMSLHYELWETDSGIFDALLDAPGEQTATSSLADSVDLEEASRTSDKSVQTEQESDLVEAGSLEPGDYVFDELIDGLDMIQTSSIYANARPTSHSAQQRNYQVHARMQGLLRGSSMDQRWQELASLLSLQPQHDPNGTSLPPQLPHHFPPHHHHPHLHHPPPSLHHHSMHHPPFSSAGPPAVAYPDTTRSILLQNSSLPVPPPEINSTSYPNVAMGPPPNLGSALASSMHITNSSEPMIDPSSHYKMIESNSHHDMLYYQNMTSSAEMSNQSTEGFLSSILNDDDLQLMDMAMNEGMYTMRMMDNSTTNVGNAGTVHGLHQVLPPQSNCSIGPSVNATAAVTEDRMEASSDSAVSSMGSERVPPMTDPHMSDNEWTDHDPHPHSSHDSNNYNSDFSSKLRNYGYYGKGDGGVHRVAAPVAQKKHQMFGKRGQHEQGVHPYGPHAPSGLCVSYPTGSGLHQPSGVSMDPLEMKYSCSVDFTRHDGEGRLSEGPVEIHNNHSYSLPQSHMPNSSLSLRSQRPTTKEKLKKEYLSRDEKRARALNLPLNTDDIINLPMDEFNERLSKEELTESQLSLIRDIRRRGKNKVAAQNCRKRKLDQILQLAEEVSRIRDKKLALLRDQETLKARRTEVREKYSQLYRIVLRSLEDPITRNPINPFEWSLQQAADGNIVMVPQNAYPPSASSTLGTMDSSMRRGKTKDEIKKDGQA